MKMISKYVKGLLHEGESRYATSFLIIILIFLTIMLLWVMRLSLAWRMVHDSPIMLYMAFLMDKFDFIPYRDIFDMNLPGTYLIYYVIGHFSNYSDFGFRIADLLFLMIILTSTWLGLRDVSWKMAWCAAVTFGLLYFSWGPTNSLQREYILLLPLSITLLFTISLPRLNNKIRWLTIGLFGGFSFLIKPHALIFYVAIALYQILDSPQNNKKSKIIKIITCYGLGFLVPNLIALFYLWKHQALSYFYDSAIHYLPLYASLNGDHAAIFGIDRLKYLFSEYFRFGAKNIASGTLIIWLLPTGIGAYLTLQSASFTKQQKKTIWLLISLLFLASVYPVFSGQFWSYHYFLFLYFAVVSSSLCVTYQYNANNLLKKILPMAIFLLVFLLQISHLPEVLKYAKLPPRNVDLLASVLQANVQKGDTVQPLDWTAGALHAMLIAKTRIATPFIYDFHFYHSISNPYIQQLRKRFLNSLKISRPKYIVQINLNDQPPVKGKDTTRIFSELDTILHLYYEVWASNTMSIIYMRK